MTAILYPVAETAEAALHAARGYAARAREAEALAGSGVAFVTETIGPAFQSREAALDAYVARRPVLAAEASTDAGADGWLTLVPVATETGGRVDRREPVRPAFKDGRRWPEPTRSAVVLWRLSVAFWRIGGQDIAAPLEAARRMRRDAASRDLGGPVLNALARQPLRALRPQQPLDIGLFETRPPEAPDTLIPDE